MNKQAILHTPMSSYAEALDSTTVLFRIRVAKGDIHRCQLVYGDTGCRVTPITTFVVDMNIAYQDEYFDYYQVIFNCQFHRICYGFCLNDGRESIYYYGDKYSKELPIDRSEYYKLPFVWRDTSNPSWFCDAVVYNIFPDSFATSHRHISGKGECLNIDGHTYCGNLGGTINGIRDNLDYIQSLGANTVYLNPIFSAGQYHKYDIIDYYSIDPCFGTNQEFRQLVRDIHARGMKIIIDGVFNHCGWNFFAFEDCVVHGDNSIYKDWFYRLQFPVVRPDNQDDYPTYECFGYERLMPKLDTNNEKVQQYFCDVGAYWVEEYDIDGWRLDVADEVSDEFWRKFNQRVRKNKSDVVLIGEVWQQATHWLDGSMFNSSMNYVFLRSCRDYFALGNIDACQFNGNVTNMLTTYLSRYNYQQLNILDSHDVPRFLSLCQGNIPLYRLAVIFLMTFVGVPSVFYGDEQGIEGVKECQYRQPMRFGKHELMSFYQQIIQLRKNYTCLSKGNYRALQYEQGSRLYIYQREYDGERIVVMLNADNSAHKTNISGKVLISYNFDGTILGAYGYAIILLGE